MSVGLLRFVLGQALSRCRLPPISHVSSPTSCLRAAWGPACQRSPLCTDTESGANETNSKKPDPRARVTFSSVGRKISQRHVRLLGEDGEEMGTVHRAEVIRLMDQTGLKLVSINASSDPPVYRLMKGKQIHEEQMRLRETQKSKTGPVQSKELNFSSDISLHDLDTKLRQVVMWLEKKNHVRLSIRAGSESDVTLDKVLTQMVERISVPIGFVLKPAVVRGGRAAMCVLRLASAKELQHKATDPPAPLSASDNLKDSKQQ